MKKGKLSDSEKFEIKGRLDGNMDLSDKEAIEAVASAMDRSVRVVTTYLKELEAQQVFSAAPEEKVKVKATVLPDRAVVKEEAKKEEGPVVSKEIYDAATQLILAQGFDKVETKKLLKRAVGKLKKSPKDANYLVGLALRGINAGNLMGKRTRGGERGVSIMTPAASMRTESGRGKAFSRGASGNIFVPSENKVV